MPLAVPRYTVQDLESLPDDGNRYELLDGWLLVTPGPAPAHQAVASRLMGILRDYVSPSGALVYGPGSVEIEPSVHLEPDILVVPASQPIAKRWSEIKAWWLAVEISGRGSLVYDRDFKFDAYSALGVREVWRVDLQDRCVVERSSDNTTRTHYRAVHWHPPEFAEPLTVDIAALFDRIP